MDMNCEKCMAVSMANYKVALASKHRTIVLLFVLLIVQFIGFLCYVVADTAIHAKENAKAEDELVLYDDTNGSGDILNGTYIG